MLTIFSQLSRRRRKSGQYSIAILALLSGLWTQPVRGFIDEALSIAFEAAVPYIEQGFEVREDHWSGEIPSGQAKLVRHQLFRGNEYWFWAGTSSDDCEVLVEIFDKEGTPVGLETFSKGRTAGVRVLPSATGTYFIRVTLTSKKKQPVLDWALAYGYR